MEIKSHEFTTLVPQEHPMGCSVACVAYRVGISYQEALSLFTVKDYAWTRGYYCPEIIEALARAGFGYEYSKYKHALHKDLVLKNGTIIFIGPCVEYPSGHFFIRTPMGWMNPWATFPLISNVKAEYQKVLPGQMQYIVYQN